MGLGAIKVSTREPCDGAVKRLVVVVTQSYTRAGTHTHMNVCVTGEIWRSSLSYSNVSFLVLILHCCYVRC